MSTDVIHVITPGDHYSPRTGSAIPSVVHGLASAARAAGDDADFPQYVMVDGSTMHPRYDSALPIEYPGEPRPGRTQRYADVIGSRLGRARTNAVRYIRPLARELRLRRSGIVVAHNLPVLSSLLENSAHRVVLYAHNDVLRSYSRRELDRTLGGVEAIVCVSRSLAATTVGRLPAALAARVRVVTNGVDPQQFSPPVERAAGPLRIMFVGRVIPEKGADVLLRAMGLLDREDVEVMVVGSGGFDTGTALSRYEARLRNLASRVAGPVLFQPFVERSRLPEMMRRADILVVPSAWPDPSPLIVGEGLATGLPVVASGIGGIPELVGDAGVLVPPGDPRALATVLERLLDDASERERMAVAARARAVARDWGSSWREFSTVLRNLGPSAAG